MRLFNAIHDQLSRRLNASKAGGRSAAQPPLLRTLRLEPLEIRKLLSVDIVWNSGALTITSTSSGDNVSVGSYWYTHREEGDPDSDTYVQVSGTRSWYGHNDLALAASVTSISIDMGGGNDSVDLLTVTDQYFTGSPSVSVDGGSGDDNIDGSGFGDHIEGGYGADDIEAFGGDDDVYGDRAAAGHPGDDDTLYGGDGDDWIEGGDGDDWIYGGDGADDLYGQGGVDWIWGNEYASWGDGDEDVINGGSGDPDYGFGELGDIFNVENAYY